MNEYPFELWIMVLTGSPTIDANGFTTEAPTEWVMYSACYEQVLGSGAFIRTDKGENIVFSSKIFLPADTESLLDGTTIQVRDGARIRFEGTVKRFSVDLNHCRIFA
jgi:hypothetical protein